MILGRLVASGKPVEVTRYAGTVGQGIMLQLTAETGYVQVQLAELLRMLHNPRTEDVPDPWQVLEQFITWIDRLDEIGHLGDEERAAPVVARARELLDARRVATATSEPPKP